MIFVLIFVNFDHFGNMCSHAQAKLRSIIVRYTAVETHAKEMDLNVETLMSAMKLTNCVNTTKSVSITKVIKTFQYF